MVDTEHPIVNVSALRAGELVEVHSRNQGTFRGLVEECQSSLNVVWVRDLQLGERRLISTYDHSIFRC